ncbi:Alkylglycerol monooxygenase [Amphibalanus amphitrite]|uniref:Alkylglycerol monooxygenase n=1 Tax=Amphibalanus amphitrite TaxID=1232801 RepID=A0A6A4WA69_AMPAM|nr:Alkylglycerol monooxygenase [Amphibalanus amphitrite]
MGPDVGKYVEQVLGMFYIRNVTASFVPPMKEPPNYIEQALPWFFVFIAIEAVLIRLKGRKWDLADATVSTSQGLAQEVVRYTLRGCEGWAYVYIWQHYRWFDVPWDSPVSFWFTIARCRPGILLGSTGLRTK